MLPAFPPSTDYDKASRYLVKEGGEAVMRRLLSVSEAEAGWVGWIDTKLAMPDVPERLVDLVARLTDARRNGWPVAALVELQTDPDPLMTGRLLIAGGLAWTLMKPADSAGDRFDVCAVVVNLSGVGNASRRMSLGTTEWTLTVCEWNLSTLDAGEMLDEIEAETTPMEFLAWIPLMLRGGDDDIIERWRPIAGRLGTPRRRANLALVTVFAEKAGNREKWEKVMEGMKVQRPQTVLAWIAEGKAEGLIEGKVEGKVEGIAEGLLKVLRLRFDAVPADLERIIRDTTDSAVLDDYFVKAHSSRSLKKFRAVIGK